jgi:hypothetical protein
MRLQNGKVVMSDVEYEEFQAEDLGICMNCGATRDSCEPDAREYPCESCDSNAVFGVEELMQMDKIVFDVVPPED